MFPGKDITDEKRELVAQIDSKMNPMSLSSFEVLDQATPTGVEVFSSDFFVGNDTFYLLYEHPVLQHRKKLFLVEKDELLCFLKDKIDPDRMEGLDVTVATFDLRSFLICNHDGEMYLLRTS